MSSGTGYRPQSYLPDGLARMLETLRSDVEKLKRYRAPVINHDEQDADEIVQAGARPQLLIMSATADSIASGGDFVTFGTIVDQHGFADVGAAGASWTHPVTGPYVLTFELSWDTYQDGGTVAVYVAGTAVPGGTLGAGTGQNGRGTITYWAEEGQTGAIRVTQSSGSAQTCDATVWVAMPDAAPSTSSAGVRLYIDDELVAYAPGSIPTGLTDATVLTGAMGSMTSSAYYDDIRLLQPADLLSNGGFESATVAWDGTSVVTGNFATYAESGGSTARSSTQANTGTYSADVDAVADVAYVLQDVTMADGTDFSLDLYVYPVTLTGQRAAVLFDWTRSGGSYAEIASAVFGSSSTSIDAFGLAASGPALPTGQWSKVTLTVTV